MKKHLIEIREGESVYAFVGPFEDAAAARVWKLGATEQLTKARLQANGPYPLWDPDETLTEIENDEE